MTVYRMTRGSKQNPIFKALLRFLVRLEYLVKKGQGRARDGRSRSVRSPTPQIAKYILDDDHPELFP